MKAIARPTQVSVRRRGDQMTHYAVLVIAVLTAIALRGMGQNSLWALVLGWALTSLAVAVTGAMYLWRNGGWHPFRGR